MYTDSSFSFWQVPRHGPEEHWAVLSKQTQHIHVTWNCFECNWHNYLLIVPIYRSGIFAVHLILNNVHIFTWRRQINLMCWRCAAQQNHVWKAHFKCFAHCNVCGWHRKRCQTLSILYNRVWTSDLTRDGLRALTTAITICFLLWRRSQTIY